ncbi:HAD family hydrolase [Halobacteriales archaeon QH_3_68_24]|nr:MAG: HAD family hydrolase [Halobacteriales archaeon QH_3_68_24]
MIEGVVLDLDGTVYRGGDPIPGTADAVARLREAGLGVVFCSNNPTGTPAGYADRLAGMGIDADPEDVVPASTVTRDYLRRHHPDEPTYLVGAPALAEYLREAGQQVVETPDASVFVASWDERFDYTEMRTALDCIDEETVFLGTDPDRTVPDEGGPMPGSGAVIAAVAGTVGRDPDRVLGKPSDEAADAVLDRLGVPADRCLVVGDRLDTDLAMGVSRGMATALVATGVTDPATLDESPAIDPDVVLDSLADLPGYLL